MLSALNSKIIGYILLVSSAVLIFPLFISLFYQDGQAVNFIGNLLFLLFGALITIITGRGDIVGMKRRHGFILVVEIWIVFSFLCAFPLYIGVEGMSFTGAIFESVSALTTTGATVLSHIDDLPVSILFLRQELQWVGGIGIVVIAIAVIPMLGAGGTHLLRSEVPGPMKEEKILPRLASSVRVILLVYTLLTLLCAGLYWFYGMSLFDAICHSMATVSTGGFSTHDQSMGFFDSQPLEIICIIFMIISSISFSQHFIFLATRNFSTYLKSDETRRFISLMFLFILLAVASIYLFVFNGSFENAFRFGLFEVVSTMTSTGFGAVDMAPWPAFVSVLILLMCIPGGCTGSTAGGIKIFRVDIIIKVVKAQFVQLMHPHAVIRITHNNKTVDSSIFSSIWGYLSLYVFVFVVIDLLFVTSGMDSESSFGATVTTLNNYGPGLGEVASSFGHTSAFQQLLGALSMLLGRLEIFPFMILLVPGFWKEL